MSDIITEFIMNYTNVDEVMSICRLHYETLTSILLQHSQTKMQDPNEDTEWNDILRAKGIIPEKPKEKEITEDQIVAMLEKTVKEKTGEKAMEDMTLDELDELEDEEEERILEEMRRKRMREIKERQERAKFGDVREISAQDYVQEVNKAGDGVYVVLHLYKQGVPLCALINRYVGELAAKFPSVKFLKSISTTCIPNYPDRNLPTIFVYHEGEMKAQLAGPHNFRGMNMSAEEFEYILGRTGAIETEIKKDPRQQVEDVMFSKLGSKGKKGGKDESDSDSDNDW